MYKVINVLTGKAVKGLNGSEASFETEQKANDYILYLKYLGRTNGIDSKFEIIEMVNEEE